MASTDQDIRRELGEEREKLAEAVETLRAELGEATDIGGKLKARLPLAAAGALGLGFLASGGIGATARLLMRRGREGEPRATVGRFRLIDRS
ncbi:MAG: hypothetical protein QOK22_2744 [Gaiellaceae bacterium]|jgi:hypothetical protein|nr:hypothetical protein [Gaiellaceae bacterium]